VITEDLLDQVLSLTLIVDEETQRLREMRGGKSLAELVGAKTRLVGQLEAEIARLDRADPAWTEHLPADEHETLDRALDTLRSAMLTNADVVARNLEVTSELLDVLGDEARRLASRRASTYTAEGALPEREAVPITIDTRL
jgi:flagellar biosynthesis/type III secretory pathway chaperone